MDLNTANESLARNVFMYLCCAEDVKDGTDFNGIGIHGQNGSRNGAVINSSSTSTVFLLQRNAELPSPASIAAPLKNSLGAV